MLLKEVQYISVLHIQDKTYSSAVLTVGNVLDQPVQHGVRSHRRVELRINESCELSRLRSQVEERKVLPRVRELWECE